MQPKKCPPAPSNKEQYIKEIGQELVATYGKKDFYKPEEVRQSHQKKKCSLDLDPDFACWAMSIFSSHQDFDVYHRQEGPMCDYSEMRTEMLGGSESDFFSDLVSIPDFDLDGSWIYLTETASAITDGVGSFFSGLADLFDV